VTIDKSLNPDSNNKVKQPEKVNFNLSDLEKKELLGSGVSGDVYRAEHKNLNKSFALKVVPYKDDKTFKSLIENEVKALHGCKSEHLIKCYASYIDNNSVNIVLEYMDMGTLSDIIKKVKKIPENMMGIITVHLLKGLHFMHSRKIIHRDMKPSNVLVNSKGEVKISDFGVSTFVKETLGRKMTMVGTYLYMAPERISNEPYTMVSDIWSLGMSIIECVTGVNPYTYGNNNRQNVDFWDLMGNLKEPPPKLNPIEFSEEICEFVACCLVQDQKDRSSAEKLMSHKFIKMYMDVPKSELKNWLKTI
jgi:serine/threonine protein kinase